MHKKYAFIARVLKKEKETLPLCVAFVSLFIRKKHNALVASSTKVISRRGPAVNVDVISQKRLPKEMAVQMQ